MLDLQALLAEVDDKRGFGRRIDYGVAPIPPLPAEAEAWAREVVASVG